MSKVAIDGTVAIDGAPTLYEKCPKYRVVHVFNKLFQSLQNIERISVFKEELFVYLLSRNLYSVREFFE
jgi:hypothetical protein